jgi:hypothetical protein
MCQYIVRLLQVCVILIISLIYCSFDFRIAVAYFSKRVFTYKFCVMKVKSIRELSMKFHFSNRLAHFWTIN